jgi:pyruvate dehydrogenase E2 component (dihydrolipoamide acetyltransferase)
MDIEIKIPDIAENVEKGIIASILVARGDKVSIDKPLVELETDKATTDIPSPVEGIVKEIYVKEGDEVKVHQVIMIMEISDSSEVHSAENKMDGRKKPPDEQSGKEPPINGRNDLSSVPASPLARKIAREYNVDIRKLEGTQSGQRITRMDVENYITQKGKTIQTRGQGSPEHATEKENVSYEPMSNIRKVIAKNTEEAWQTIPHVTQFGEADITLIEEFRAKNLDAVAAEGGKLTITALLVKIIGFALQRFPRFNATIDMSEMQIIYNHKFNIGIAVDTPKGLLVPVIKDVGRKSLSEISAELSDLSGKARENKISINDLTGGTFTVSNLGGIGGTGFTPIIFKPQVAILGVSKARMQQTYIDNEFKARLILPLSLSYDHRLIDGADGARFLSWICSAIEKPFAILQ